MPRYTCRCFSEREFYIVSWLSDCVVSTKQAMFTFFYRAFSSTSCFSLANFLKLSSRFRFAGGHILNLRTECRSINLIPDTRISPDCKNWIISYEILIKMWQLVINVCHLQRMLILLISWACYSKISERWSLSKIYQDSKDLHFKRKADFLLFSC